MMFVEGGINSMGCFVQGVKFVCDVLLRVAEMTWDGLSRV